MDIGYEYTFCLGNIGMGEPQWRFTERHIDDKAAIERATKVASLRNGVVQEGQKIIAYRKEGADWINVTEVTVDRAVTVKVNLPGGV